MEGEDKKPAVQDAAVQQEQPATKAAAASNALDEIARSLSSTPAEAPKPVNQETTAPQPAAADEDTAVELLLGIRSVSNDEQEGTQDDKSIAAQPLNREESDAKIPNPPPAAAAAAAAATNDDTNTTTDDGKTGSGAIRRSTRQVRSTSKRARLPKYTDNDDDNYQDEDYKEDDDDEEPAKKPARKPATAAASKKSNKAGAAATAGGKGNTKMSSVDIITEAAGASGGTAAAPPLVTNAHPPLPAPASNQQQQPQLQQQQKSELTTLCERFINFFGHLTPEGGPQLLLLNDIAETLGVPRRRLYDVINVFESVDVMKRVGKLMYEFCGYDHLADLFRQLAEEEEQGLPVEDRTKKAPLAVPTTTSQAAATVTVTSPAPVAAATYDGGALITTAAGDDDDVNATTTTAAPAPAAGNTPKPNSHSLWVLSRRLVRMLLKADGAISLTSAAATLVGSQGVTDPSKRTQSQVTVERRLYDIGSILCSLGLVQRVYLRKRQPAFEWIYGWKPGDDHEPPELEVSRIAKQPAPPTAMLPDKSVLEARKKAGGARGAEAKRKREENSAAAASAAQLAQQQALATAMGMGAMGMNPFMTAAAGGWPGMTAAASYTNPAFFQQYMAAATGAAGMSSLMMPPGPVVPPLDQQTDAATAAAWNAMFMSNPYLAAASTNPMALSMAMGGLALPPPVPPGQGSGLPATYLQQQPGAGTDPLAAATALMNAAVGGGVQAMNTGLDIDPTFQAQMMSMFGAGGMGMMNPTAAAMMMAGGGGMQEEQQQQQ